MKRVLIALLAFASFSSNSRAATTWSNCVNITSVQDYRALSSSIFITTSPAIAQCAGEPLSRPIATIGQENQTADSIKGFLGESLLAYVTGKKVMLYFTQSAAGCQVQIIAIGGYTGQCN